MVEFKEQELETQVLKNVNKNGIRFGQWAKNTTRKWDIEKDGRKMGTIIKTSDGLWIEDFNGTYLGDSIDFGTGIRNAKKWAEGYFGK